MGKTFAYTGGYDTNATFLTFSDDAELPADYRDVVCATASAASKTLTLGLANGETLLLVNVGASNAFTAANLEGDTGTSIGAGKVALIIGSSTADGTKIYVLN